jgi:hypothetical protein
MGVLDTREKFRFRKYTECFLFDATCDRRIFQLSSIYSSIRPEFVIHAFTTSQKNVLPYDTMPQSESVKKTIIKTTTFDARPLRIITN